MKQQITESEWKKLSKRQQDNWEDWDRERAVGSLSIYPNLIDMIEYLGDEWYHSKDEVFLDQYIVFGPTHCFRDKKLCNAYWLACKHKLNDYTTV